MTEMTNAYAAFANQGERYSSLNLITEVKDKFGKNANWQASNKQQSISKGGAYLISNILSDNAARAGMLREKFSALRVVTLPNHWRVALYGI